MKVVKVGAGKNHSVVVTEDGSFFFAFGWNKHGQPGLGSIYCMWNGVSVLLCTFRFYILGVFWCFLNV